LASAATFGDLLHQHRLRVGLTQDALAERAGISERAISDLERGLRRAPHDDTVRRLADALDLNAADIAVLRAVGRQPRKSSRREPGSIVVESPVFSPPALPTRTIGRERELAAIRDILLGGQTRLLTLTGPGGSGKTRLSIAAASALAREFECGAAFVELAAITDTELVLGAIAESVGVHETPGVLLRASLTAFLRDKSLLLILDNFEQVAGAATLIANLLDACAGLKVIATSRASLRVRAESEFPVVPLPIPNRPSFSTIEKLAQVPAVQLFVERTQAVRPGFALTGENAAAVAELCVRLEGLPLAIELAAARGRALTPAAMLERLDSRLRLLVGGPRDLPERHQTMRAAILWSYDLLTQPEQALFRRLAVFTGGCTLDACEAICDAQHDLDMDVLDGLDSLVGHSVLRQEEQGDGELRFRMLETIRELAQERLRASGEGEGIADLHGAYYRDLAESASPLLKGAERKPTLQRLRTERDNLRQALTWAISSGDAGLGLRLMSALDWWYRSEAPAEGQRWGEAVLALGDAKTLRAERAATIASVGAMLRLQGNQASAREWLEESVSIWREVGDQVGLAHALVLLGWSLTAHPDEAFPVLEECIALLRECGSSWDLAYALLTEGMVAIASGDVDTARRVLDECVSLQRVHDDAWLAGQAMFYLGRIEAHAGSLEAATARYQASLAIFEEIGDKFYTSAVLLDLAIASLIRGDLARTANLCVEGVALSRREGLLTGLSMHLTGLAAVISHLGDTRQAARLFSAGDALRERLDFQVGSFKDAYQRYIDTMRAQLGDEIFDVAWEQGRALPLDDAVAEALGAVRDLGIGAPALLMKSA
jgi:predicted ATPase/transcriptional regulator with XRE-family HTH domain